MITQKQIMNDIDCYAASDRSDPFTRDRCLAHARSGIVGLNTHNELASYSATPFLERRSFQHNGEIIEYTVTVYKNIQRP